MLERNEKEKFVGEIYKLWNFILFYFFFKLKNKWKGVNYEYREFEIERKLSRFTTLFCCVCCAAEGLIERIIYNSKNLRLIRISTCNN